VGEAHLRGGDVRLTDDRQELTRAKHLIRIREFPGNGPERFGLELNGVIVSYTLTLADLVRVLRNGLEVSGEHLQRAGL
jgi:hypothetical protein